MSDRYKAAFIDLDGTLLNPNVELSEANRQCILDLKAKNIPVVFSTGRPIESLRILFANLHTSDPAITLSGSVIHPSLFEKPLIEAQIPYETMHSVLAYCETMQGIDNILLDESEGFYALKANLELSEFIGMYGKDPECFTFDKLPDSPVLSIMIQSQHHRPEVFRELQERFADQLHFTFFKEYPWIELSLVNTNKGIALAQVCDYLGLQVDEVVAIGDGANDIEMISRAGLGIAMGNADDEIKKVADLVTKSNREDGVAVALRDVFSL